MRKGRTFLVINLWNKVSKIITKKSLKVDSILIFAHAVLCLESDTFFIWLTSALPRALRFSAVQPCSQVKCIFVLL